MQAATVPLPPKNRIRKYCRRTCLQYAASEVTRTLRSATAGSVSTRSFRIWSALTATTLPGLTHSPSTRTGWGRRPAHGSMAPRPAAGCPSHSASSLTLDGPGARSPCRGHAGHLDGNAMTGARQARTPRMLYELSGQLPSRLANRTPPEAPSQLPPRHTRKGVARVFAGSTLGEQP